MSRGVWYGTDMAPHPAPQYDPFVDEGFYPLIQVAMEYGASMTTTLTPANATKYMRTYGKIPSRAVSDMTSGVKMGFYGPGGGGKTTLLGTAVESEYGSPMLYLNARGNPHVIASKGDRIQVIDVASYREAEAIRKDVYADTSCPFKSIAIDTVSELLALDLRDRYGMDTEVKWEMHSASTADILQMVRNYSDLADWGPRLNVFFVFYDVPEKRKIMGQEVERFELALNKALQSQVPGLVNWLGRVYVATGEPTYTRCLDFRPIETQSVSKHQIDPDDAAQSSIPMQIYRPHLGHILDTMKGGQPFPANLHRLLAPGRRQGAGTEATDAQ